MSEIASKLLAGVLAGLALVLVCACLLVSGQRNEARRARDALQAEVSQLSGDLAICKENASTLQGAVSAQGAATAKAAALAEGERETGQRRLAEVETENKELLARVGVLQLIVDRNAPATCQEGWNAFSSAVGK